MAYANLLDPATQGFFFRTQAGLEVELLLKFRRRLWPIEIKVSPPTSPRFLQRAMRDLGVRTGFVVNAAEEHFSPAKGVEVLPLMSFLKKMSDL